MNAPICASDWIGEYCLALAHRWDPERLIVIFTAYFDEADTHGPSPDIIMAGFLGHAFQWRRFQKKLAKIQRKENFSTSTPRNLRQKLASLPAGPTNSANA